MPFTFSHPAIILPFTYLPRKWFSFTSLIIGSLTPDFEYFIRMKVQSNYSHTFYGIFWFDLPLAIVISFLFHNLVKNDLFFNSPNFIKSRLSSYISFSWNHYFKTHWAIILISIITGIISHLFWDCFTHQHGYFTEHISVLKNTITFFGHEIPIWKISQHISTVTGAIIIILSFMKLPQNSIQHPAISQKYWTAVIILTLSILVLRFSIHLKELIFGNIIVTVISAFLISLVLSPALIKSKASSEI